MLVAFKTTYEKSDKQLSESSYFYRYYERLKPICIETKKYLIQTFVGNTKLQTVRCCKNKLRAFEMLCSV